MLDADFIAATPEAIGLSSDRLERLYDFVRAEIADGLPSAQVAVGRHGKVAGVRTFGEATIAGRRVPATNDTLYCLFSPTMPFVAENRQ